MEKKRIDVLLVEQGFFDSREKAKRAVMAGIVHNDHEIIDKPGTKSPSRYRALHVKGNGHALRIQRRFKTGTSTKRYLIFQMLKDRVMVDIGTSTGGFTDCASTKRCYNVVYAVDVGTNQLSLETTQ